MPNFGSVFDFVMFINIKDGRLAAGDQLLSVDGRSLVGLSQER